MHAFKTDVDKSTSTAQSTYSKYFDKNMQILPAFIVGHFVCYNKPPGAVLASEADEVAAASYNKLMPPVTGPYENATIDDSSLAILQNGIEESIIIDCVTKASGYHETPVTNGDTQNTRELSQTQASETDSNDNNRFVADEINQHVTESGHTKYAVQ